MKKKEWNYNPHIPIENNPLFSFPFIFKKIFKWYADMWKPLSETVFCLMIAIIYLLLLPSLTFFENPQLSTFLIIYSFNLTIMLVVAGGLHLFFYTFKKQHDQLKYDTRSINNNKKFTFNKQILDNIFWSITSGVTIWTLYQIFLLWGYSNNIISKISFSTSPILFLFLFFIIIFFESVHFYFVHRLLHFKFFYKFFHHIHHRNINPGPWSGISMHPFEHLLYFSTVLIHFIIPSHPIHILFHFMIITIGAIIGHCGFDGFFINKKNRIALGHFHHQLHHRYFECNYGTIETPIDVWFKSFHNGISSVSKQIRKTSRNTDKIL